MRNPTPLPKLLSLKLGLITILIVCVAAFASISSSEDATSQQCPTVTVSCSKERRENQEVKFEARLRNAPADLTPSYKWTVSAGSITNQRDDKRKSVITVDARGVAGGDITATVIVNNVGSNCNPTDDCETHITGTRLPNAPPTVAGMGASPSSIVICPKDPSRSDSTTIQLSVSAFDPDNDELTYTWEVTGGRIVGSGRSVKWELAGVEVGTYTATVTVSDGRNKATASTTVTITTCK